MELKRLKRPSELKAIYQKMNPDGHYFDRKTMRFFGDTMANYRLYTTEVVDKDMGQLGFVYELARAKPVKHGLQRSHYFLHNSATLEMEDSHWNSREGAIEELKRQHGLGKTNREGR